MQEEIAPVETPTETPAEETVGTPLFDEAEFESDPAEPVMIEPGTVDETGAEVTPTPEPAEAEKVVEETPTPDPVEPEEPTVLEEVALDPGDFEPKDYAFEVTIYDEEGRNGKTVKISNIEQYEQLLEADSNFGSAASLMKAQRLATRMETNNERDLQEHEAKKAAYSTRAEAEQNRVDTLNRWQAEADYLISSGELPELEAGDKDANWGDPKIAAKPGVKAQIELLNLMSEENTRRQAAGIAPLTSLIDTANFKALKDMREGNTKVRKAAGEARKAAGAKVSGTQPNPIATQPKGVMVGKSYGDLSNMGNSFNVE